MGQIFRSLIPSKKTASMNILWMNVVKNTDTQILANLEYGNGYKHFWRIWTDTWKKLVYGYAIFFDISHINNHRNGIANPAHDFFCQRKKFSNLDFFRKKTLHKLLSNMEITVETRLQNTTKKWEWCKTSKTSQC